MALWLKDMHLWLGFSPQAVILLIREQRQDSPDRLRVFMDKNVNDICNVVRKPGSKNVHGTPDRGPQVSVTAQENLKLSVFLFHHQWRCTFDWEVLGVQKDSLLASRTEQLEDKYKDPNTLPKINKADIKEMVESIE